ncbi:DUF2142 domain-containing protein [Neokomagataea tanensis]|uniref:DUF2142 domain-containing protein n=2 Tax=Neokomagataea tanensis TaxID=661191 RepID=A0A4Y6VA97_9PROT|nr:DUF2142 domain-containing protein [Neokomagataea tanensis]
MNFMKKYFLNNDLYNAFIKYYFVLISVIGIFFVFMITPVSGIDEQFHFDRALQVSQGDLLPQHRGRFLLGGDLNARLIRYAQYFEGRRDQRLSSDRTVAASLAHDLGQGPSGSTSVEFSSTASYSPIMYLPAGFGLLLGRLVHAPVDTQFFMGRLGNLLGFLASLAVVLRVLPWGRLGVLALFSTPTCLHLAAAYSADPLTNTLTLLFVACCLRFASMAQLGRRERVTLVFLGATLGLLKLTCCVFSLAVFLLPRSLFSSWRQWGYFAERLLGRVA